MNLFQMVSDAFNLSLSSVGDMGDEELLQCNQVRVILAFISWFFVLCSAYGLFLSGWFIVLVLIALGFTANSALAFFEVLDRKKNEKDSDKEDSDTDTE